RADLDLRVLFALLPDARRQGVGFDRAFEWDVPLLDGYEWELLPNGVEHARLDGFLKSSTPTIRRRLRDLAPDVVLVTGWHQRPLVQALVASRRLGVPILLRGESNDLRSRPHPVRWAQRALLSICAGFL